MYEADSAFADWIACCTASGGAGFKCAYARSRGLTISVLTLVDLTCVSAVGGILLVGGHVRRNGGWSIRRQRRIVSGLAYERHG